MEIYTDCSPISSDIWTYDKLINSNRIGAIRDPLIMNTISGRRMVPAILEYKRSNVGDRTSPLVSGYFEREIFDYSKALLYKDSPQLASYLIYDEVSQVYTLGFSIDEETRIISAKEMFWNILESNTNEGRSLYRLVCNLPPITLGVHGSWAAMLQKEGSDIDLFIEGGRDFSIIEELLRSREFQKEVGLVPLDSKKQDIYAKDYSQRFNIQIGQARRIALQRSRYLIKLDDGRMTKVAFSGSFSKNEYKMQTVLGSKKVRKIEVEGITVGTHNAGSFPREYLVNIDSEMISVTSRYWVLQKMVNVGESVRIRGMLREKDGHRFISLEDYEDIIIATC